MIARHALRGLAFAGALCAACKSYLIDKTAGARRSSPRFNSRTGRPVILVTLMSR
ncbi:MAG: hypothetical protein ABI664_16810 [bacterium]